MLPIFTASHHNKCTAIVAIFLLCSFTNKVTPKVTMFKFESFKLLKKIPEPSDIVYDKDNDHYYIVSDHGILFETDTTGNIIRKAEFEGLDFEGVEIRDSFIYVSDETPRRVYKYRKSDFAMVKEYQVSYTGPLNKAFESITYNYAKNCFILVSQEPVSIYEYNEKFQFQERFPFHIAHEISDARWYNGELYFLSSYDQLIYRVDPNTYEVKEEFKINVSNPEGLAFDKHGKVTITSDDLQRIYFFNQLPTNTSINTIK